MSIRLAIEVDGPVRVGERLEATVQIDADQGRDVDGVTLTLKGSAWVWATEEPKRILVEERRLSTSLRIEAGQHRFRASFAIPDDAPPSCDGDLQVVYELSARAEIPWWFDASAHRPVVVLPRPPGERPPPGRAAAVATDHGAQALYLELSLDDAAWAPGETITGAFSIGNVGATRLDAATVSIEAPPSSLGVAIPGDRSVFVSLVDLHDGAVRRFSLPIPKEAVPSFTSRVGDVTRVVRVRIDGTLDTCSVPIVIDAWPPREGALETRAPVGGERWRAVWREEGAHFGLALAADDLALRGALAGGAARVTVRARGNELAAVLDWESLGLGLRVQRRGLMLLSGVDLEDVSPAFAARFAARGREDAQVRAALDAAVCALLVTFDDVELHDHGATLSRAKPARDAEALRSFLHAVADLAAAVAAAVDRLPPPSWVRPEVLAAWRAFAAATAGRLLPGPMKIRGALVEGERVDVEVVPEGGPPEATRLVLHLDPPVEEPAITPDEALAAVVALVGPTAPAPQLDMAADELRLTMARRLDDPGELRPIVAGMGRLAARLRGEQARGPYR